MTRDRLIAIVTGAMAFAIVIMLTCVYMLIDWPRKRTIEINYAALHEEVQCAQDRLNDR